MSAPTVLGVTSQVGVDWGFATGRYYLSVWGVITAVEGDPDRNIESDGPRWTESTIKDLAARCQAAQREDEARIRRAAVLDCARKAQEEADRIFRGPRTYEAAFAQKALREFAAKLREEAK